MIPVKNFFTCSIVGVAAVLATALGPQAANAGEVALKSADGTVNLVGELVEYSNDSYVIRTALGELRVAASRVRCEGESCPVFETAEADVAMVGSEELAEGVMPLLMSGYAGFLDAEATISNTQVDGQFLASLVGESGFGDEIGTYLVSSTSSDAAFAALMSKQASVGLSSRRIRPDEARALRDAGAGNMISPTQERIIAADSLVIIVNPLNRLRSISMDDLRKIYSGEYTNWSQLGLDDAPIRVVAPQDGSDTSAVFDTIVFGGIAPQRPAGYIAAEDNSSVAAAVNDDPNAIGFVGYAFQRGAKPLSLVNECNITMMADSFSAKTEEYALQRRLYLYTTQSADQVTQDFLNFTQSESADGVIAKAGFIDLGIERRNQSLDDVRATQLLTTDVDAFEGNVIREFLAQMIQFNRLSTTFRFRLGSSSLDERARIDMERLTSYLEKMPDGTRVMMVGFTDDIGEFESNRRLSEERARQAVQELRTYAGSRLDGIELSSSGYGEIAPVACNITETGRSINRRVEVWIDKIAEG